MKQQNLSYIAGNSPYIPPLPDCETKAFSSALLANIKKIERRRKERSFFLSFGRRSVNENSLSVKGEVHCFRNP